MKHPIDEYDHHWHEERDSEHCYVLAACMAGAFVIIILSVLS
jgi:hypothetical protein